MLEAIDPIQLAGRVAALVDRHDGGDVVRAARRIGARPSDLRSIVEATVDHPSLSTLSAVVRGYDVDAWWLISGETGVDAGLPADRRVQALNLLSELAAAMTMQRRLWYGGTGTTPLDLASLDPS
jgi:hypothetical protein